MSPATPLAIRPAEPADARLIAAYNTRLAIESEGLVLNQELLLPGIQALLADPAKGRYFIAESGSAVAGQLMHTYEWSDWRNGMFWWIQSVYVAPEFRRQGVFRALYQHLEDLSKNDPGVCGLRLYVEKDNVRAQDTYLHCGLSRTGYAVMAHDYRQPNSET